MTNTNQRRLGVPVPRKRTWDVLDSAGALINDHNGGRRLVIGRIIQIVKDKNGTIRYFILPRGGEAPINARKKDLIAIDE